MLIWLNLSSHRSKPTLAGIARLLQGEPQGHASANQAPYRIAEPEATWNVPVVSFFNPPPGSDDARSGGTATIPELYLAEVGPATIIGGYSAILVSGTQGDQTILYDMIEVARALA